MSILFTNGESPIDASRRGSTVEMFEEQSPDPIEWAESERRRERFHRNLTWFKQHAEGIYASHRGSCICVAGGQLFSGETPEEVLASASAAHPADDGRLLLYIPREKVARIYVSRR